MRSFAKRLEAMQEHATTTGKTWIGYFKTTKRGQEFFGMNRKDRRDAARSTQLSGSARIRAARRKLLEA